MSVDYDGVIPVLITMASSVNEKYGVIQKKPTVISSLRLMLRIVYSVLTMF